MSSFLKKVLLSLSLSFVCVTHGTCEGICDKITAGFSKITDLFCCCCKGKKMFFVEILGEEKDKIIGKIVNDNFVTRCFLLKEGRKGEKRSNEIESENKGITITVKDGKIINCKDEENKLNLKNNKYCLFRVKYKVDANDESFNETNPTETNIVYLYCSDIESVNNNGTFSGVFDNNKHITEIETIAADTSGVGFFSYMFYKCSSLQNIEALKNWNVSNGKDFSNMFDRCSSLKNIDALKNWNVSNGTNFSYMFCNCNSLQNIDALKNWNVSNGIDFHWMFFGCSNLKKKNLPSYLKGENNIIEE